jgi:hypothetical protein
MKFLNIVDETENGFKKIANTLFHECAIQTHKALYRFVEIEFYWQSQSHNDVSTYDRRHVDPKTGDWFFHYSGVDIALRNENTRGYGGILIRSIYDLDTKLIVKGPLVCMMKLFSETSAFSESIKTKIISYNFPEAVITTTGKIGLGKIAKESGVDKLNYRFVINPNQ